MTINFRMLAERLSRRVVLSRQFPPSLGGATLYVSPGASGLRCWKRSLVETDPHLLERTREIIFPGAVVWDIGANQGLFTFCAAGLAGPDGEVLAVEADTWLVELLRRSARANSPAIAPVTVLSAAASESVGLATFCIASRARSTNHLEGYGHGTPQVGRIRERQMVVCLSLDWLFGHFRAPDVVKIDVEGAELGVLSGARELLKCKRPTLLMEVLQEHRIAVTEYLHALNYELYDADCTSGNRTPIREATWNTLALARASG